MELRYLRYFVAVAEELNFTRAAERLHTAQPSLSRQIRQLEEIVGAPLFDRDKHHVQLTTAGRVMLREARQILHKTDDAVVLARRAADDQARQLTIGFVVSAEMKVLPHILPLLAKRSPQLRVVVRSLRTPEQIAALHARTIDVGLLRPPVDDPEITTELVLRDALVVVLPINHPLAAMSSVPLSMLSPLPCVAVPRASAPALHDAILEACRKAGVELRVMQDADNVLANLNLVSAGLGFSFAPDYVRSILPKSVVARPLAGKPLPGVKLLAAHRRGDTSLAVRALMDAVHCCFAEKNSPAA